MKYKKAITALALAALLLAMRKRVPDITLRTSLICGFPGETKEQHEELMQFVNDMEFYSFLLLLIQQ